MQRKDTGSLLEEQEERVKIAQMYREKFNTASFLDQYHTFLKMGGRIKHQLNFYNVPCNVMEEPALLEHKKLYDVVITSLVAEVVATNLEEVSLYLARIGRFVKPGGTLLYYGVENRIGYYDVACGGNHFPHLHVTAEFVMSVLEAAGFKDLILQTYEPDDDPNRVFRSIIGTAK